MPRSPRTPHWLDNEELSTETSSGRGYTAIETFGHRYVQGRDVIPIFLIIIAFVFLQPAVADEKTFDLGNGLKISIEEKKFDPSEWDITYCPNTKFICLINGKVPYGVDNVVPSSYLSKLTATVNSKSYQLDTTNMFNAWGERPLEHPGAIKYFSGTCENPKWCIFRGIFSDAAGTFIAEWQVRWGVPERTVITTASDIVNLFMKHIDPPGYK